MACTLRELKEWIELISKDAVAQDDLIAVDDGGVTLVVQDDPVFCFEIGGIREDFGDDE
jgi:hypothetical protein